MVNRSIYLLNNFFLLVFLLPLFLFAQKESNQIQPVEYVFDKVDSVNLKAFVFSPQIENPNSRLPAIVIFHGGGWAMGEPSWAFPRARHFAEKGMIAIAAQYRLSNQRNITPIEAMRDARTILRWLRRNSDLLRIQEDSIAAYGWSAGAHLAASAAIFTGNSDEDLEISCMPNALILVSPALSLSNEGWVKKILLNRAPAKSISPAEHVHGNMPPTLILIGRQDTVTPLKGTQEFCQAMEEKGNSVELHVFDNVGHLFTPASEPDDGWPNPDKKVQGQAFEIADAFLHTLGFIKSN